MAVEGLPFVKMHGLGNAYVFVDGMGEGVPLPEGVEWSRLARAVADPDFGVGSDGLILMAPGASQMAAMRIFNADGSEGEMCGNGVRCLAMWAHQAHGAPRRFGVETRAGVRTVEVVESPAFGLATVRVEMGRPAERGPGGVPLGAPLQLEAGGQMLEAWPVGVGNPHLVLFVDDVASAPVGRLGPLLERHPLFPQRTNVEFVEVAGPRRLRMRVWERGSGETQACGTGACASLVAAAATGRAGREAQVELAGGRLAIEWADDGRLWMTGPARLVAVGTLPWSWVKEVAGP
ncbi:diaminopimelate epimerase [Geochorda subterranea]|uniref:Diaminopimelate epimerase n=2 Tax=Geochorda subterranea TaxID=3109564 RepID=A0ABZ1BK67_9FIRM|nr:diaminopimelate epimerase [Limnochorda sp. LNt]WRP13272.1 diaminopimelate epimerase [Limnochorda sp. LNt]